MMFLCHVEVVCNMCAINTSIAQFCFPYIETEVDVLLGNIYIVKLSQVLQYSMIYIYTKRLKIYPVSDFSDSVSNL